MWRLTTRWNSTRWRRAIVGQRLLILATLLCSAPVAVAGFAVLTWTPPTENTDGSPYLDPDGYNVYYGCAQSGVYSNPVRVTDAAVDSWTLNGLPDGVTCYFAVSAVNESGLESELSNEATKLMPGVNVVPEPPTDLTVQPEDLVVYGITQTPDFIALTPRGTTQAGVACDGTMSVLGRYRVPRSEVTWYGNVRPLVVFASCSP